MLNHPNVVKMVHARVDDEVVSVTSSMASMKVEAGATKK